MTSTTEMMLIATDDSVVHGTVAGSGPPVVLLHGWPQTRAEWRDVIPLLATRYQVIAVDLPGLGLSPNPADYRKAAIAETVRSAIRTVTGDRPIRLVGHDWGGIVALFWAMDQPASLSQLAVIDVWWFPDLDQLPLMIPGGNPLWHLAFHAIPGLPELLTQGREEGYLRWFFDHGASGPGSVSPAAVAEYVTAYSQPGAMSSGFDYYRAIAADRDDARARADVRLALPVLAIGGQRSLAEAVGTSLQRIAPAVRTVVISESGVTGYPTSAPVSSPTRCFGSSPTLPPPTATGNQFRNRGIPVSLLDAYHGFTSALGSGQLDKLAEFVTRTRARTTASD